MGSVLDPADRKALLDRIASLGHGSRAVWGRMSVDAMLSHLCQSSLMALGELPVVPHGKRAFERFPLKHLILYVLPFPKGVPTAPELLAGEAMSVTEGQVRLQRLLERIGVGPDGGVGPRHPLLGELSRTEWGTLMYKHVDHHLRQFGA